MNSIPKLLIFAGISLIVVGLLWTVISKYLPLGKIPGDIVVEKENFKFYFPIVTCIILSIVISLIAYIMRILLK